MNAIRQVPCPTCGAEVGDACKKLDANTGEDLGERYTAFYHPTRVAAARNWWAQR